MPSEALPSQAARIHERHGERLDRVRALITEQEADAFVITAPPDVRWACGFTGSNALLLVHADGGADFVTDGRYREQAGEEVQHARVHVTRHGLTACLDEASMIERGADVLFQSDHLTVATLSSWQQELDQIHWVPVDALLSELVARKDEREIEKMVAVQRITEEVFGHLLNSIRPGVTEKALAAEITYEHLRRGGERMAFDPIVAGGPNGALPHARATGRRLQSGDLVVIDMGGVMEGYASDMTRTVALGEPGEEARSVYDAVLRAQEAALAAARAGVRSDALDAAARDVLTEAGYGDAFSHSLGHGLGLRTHEWPSVSYRREYELPEGAAVTIEPGVYLPGRFGVRIEDTVVLRRERAENLTRAPKELIVC